MDCVETPLDVLSRAATMLQKEESEASLKRHAHTSQQSKSLKRGHCTSHPVEQTDDQSSKKCMATQTLHCSLTEDENESGVKPPPPYNTIHTTPLPWQSIMMQPSMPVTNTVPGFPLLSCHLPVTLPQRPSSPDNSMPLNLCTHHKDNEPVIMSPTGSGGSDSRPSSPCVPERLLHGRPMTTATGSVFYPSTLPGASLAGLEARTTRREQTQDICDPSIEEHFRRSLGTNYTDYVSRSYSVSPPRQSDSTQQQSTSPRQPTSVRCSESPAQDLPDSKVKLVYMSGSVDDHFARSLGDQTWEKIKTETEDKSHDSVNRSHDSVNRTHDSVNRSHDSVNRSHDTVSKSHDTVSKSHDSVKKSHDSPESVDQHFAKALGANWHHIQTKQLSQS